jgi:hypothetical protein
MDPVHTIGLHGRRADPHFVIQFFWNGCRRRVAFSDYIISVRNANFDPFDISDITIQNKSCDLVHVTVCSAFSFCSEHHTLFLNNICQDTNFGDRKRERFFTTDVFFCTSSLQ